LFRIPGEEGGEVGGEGELDYGVFFFFRRVVMWSASNPAVAISLLVLEGELGSEGTRATYTWTSFTATFALGVRGAIRSEAAIRAATTKATVVKNPKTFWMRTMLECIVAWLFGDRFFLLG
jgi:hypothetical protein